jgi:hypothetical protein
MKTTPVWPFLLPVAIIAVTERKMKSRELLLVGTLVAAVAYGAWHHYWTR